MYYTNLFFALQYSEPTYNQELMEVKNSKATGICCNPFTQRSILIVCAEEWLVFKNYFMHQQFLTLSNEQPKAFYSAARPFPKESFWCMCLSKKDMDEDVQHHY